MPLLAQTNARLPTFCLPAPVTHTHAMATGTLWEGKCFSIQGTPAVCCRGRKGYPWLSIS